MRANYLFTLVSKKNAEIDFVCYLLKEINAGHQHRQGTEHERVLVIAPKASAEGA